MLPIAAPPVAVGTPGPIRSVNRVKTPHRPRRGWRWPAHPACKKPATPANLHLPRQRRADPIRAKARDNLIARIAEREGWLAKMERTADPVRGKRVRALVSRLLESG